MRVDGFRGTRVGCFAGERSVYKSAKRLMYIIDDIEEVAV